MDIRDIVTGESLFKLSLNQTVNTVMQADYRGRGANDLVICMRNGDGKSFGIVTGLDMDSFNLNIFKNQIQLRDTNARKSIWHQ